MKQLQVDCSSDLDSQGLTYIRVPAPATSASLVLQPEASKRWGGYRKGVREGSRRS